MYQKLIRKIIIGLFLTLSSHVFGITFQELSPLQKQIHALLFQIAQNETKNDKNHFAVALEIVAKKNDSSSEKTYVFLLKNIGGRISFISEGTDDVREDRKSVHDKLYGTPCKGPDGRSRGNYCYKKGFFDSEFACITFLENEENKKCIADFINEQIQDGKVTKISLHGFTTRDTCSACFQHLVSYCENANREFCNKDCFKIECKEIVSKNKETFWKKLKDTLGKKVENLSGPVDFYISSRIYFDGSTQLVGPMVAAKNNENNPMKMLVLRKKFDEKCYVLKEDFSNFIKNQDEDLDENFKNFLKEQTLTKEDLPSTKDQAIENITPIFFKTQQIPTGGTNSIGTKLK